MQDTKTYPRPKEAANQHHSLRQKLLFSVRYTQFCAQGGDLLRDIQFIPEIVTTAASRPPAGRFREAKAFLWAPPLYGITLQR